MKFKDLHITLNNQGQIQTVDSDLEEFMDRDRIYNKRTFVYGIIVMLLASITMLKLPHQGKTISEFIIPVIRLNHSALHLSGLIPLALVILSSFLFVKSGRLKNQFLVGLFLLFLALPLIGKGLDLLKIPVYMMSDGVKGVELNEADLNIHGDNGVINIDFEAEVMSYIDDDSHISVYVELPDVIQKFIEEDVILVYEGGILDKGRSYSIKYSGILDISDGYDDEDLFDTDYYWEDYKVIFKDNEQSFTMKVNDGLF